MTMLNKLRLRLQALFFKSRLEEELDEEVRFHLEREIRENIARGMSPEEARLAALRSFGGVERVKEESRDVRGIRLLEELWQDLRYGARMLLKNLGFTLIAVLTLALGIGANTAIFSVVNAVLLSSLPYAEAERLVQLAERSREGARFNVAYPNFEDWRVRAQSFEGMASIRDQSFNLTGVDRPTQLLGRTVNWNFFSLLGIQPQLGRSFRAADDHYGAERTAILSHAMWQDRYGGDLSVIGKAVLLNGDPYTVIGVLPPGFEYFRKDDVYVPIGLFLKPNTGLTDRGSRLRLYAVARLKPGVTLAQANSEMAALATQLAQEYPAANQGKSALAERLQDVMSENVRQSLWVLLGAVGFILLIACVNAANLLLVRAAERQKEIAVRMALGARPSRIVKQLLSESLLIAFSGGAVGLLLGQWMLNGLLALAPPNIPQLGRVELNHSVLLFTLGITALTSLLCGLLPALHTTRLDLQSVLKESGRSTAGLARERTRQALLIAEISLALVLLVGAGLLVRSMNNLLHVDLGFDADNLLTMALRLPAGNYDNQRQLVFYDECLARVSAVPGVRSAALTMSLPIDGSQWDTGFQVDGKPAPPPGQQLIAAYTPVSANYFETLGIRLVRGRVFTAADTTDSVPVTVINESLARRIWPGEDPLGKRLKQGETLREVVGVVTDLKLNGVENATPMQFYAPLAQEPNGILGLAVRTTGNPLAAAASIEQAIHTVDKDLPVFRMRTMEQLLWNALAQRRLTLALLLSLAALALLLASVGIYGVISYAVRQRTNELGIRMALGAQRRDVLKLILTQGLKLALLGVGIGLLAALVLSRWMEALLFEVRPTDPLTFAVIAAVLVLVALFACWIPAWRAAKVDPLVALRNE
jgi:putative ABC transport system permease protein